MKQAFALWKEPIGKGERHALVGAARVRIIRETRPGVYEVEVVKGSGVTPGRRQELSRSELYSTPDELEQFQKLVRQMWR